MKKIYTIEEVRKLTENWCSGTDEKAKRAWRRLWRQIKHEL
jgi:hypothetical protein